MYFSSYPSHGCSHTKYYSGAGGHKAVGQKSLPSRKRLPSGHTTVGAATSLGPWPPLRTNPLQLCNRHQGACKLQRLQINSKVARLQGPEGEPQNNPQTPDVWKTRLLLACEGTGAPATTKARSRRHRTAVRRNDKAPRPGGGSSCAPARGAQGQGSSATPHSASVANSSVHP